jgi:Domain of unknown function (DUF4382)
MRFSRSHVGSALILAPMLTAAGLAGCGNSCFVGFSNNGNGGLIIKTANPPPTCSLSQANGMMRGFAVTSRVCETCTTAARLEHVFVTLRGIQLRPVISEDTDSADWLELAPQLAKKPRQIDLVGDFRPLILVESAAIPAGSYREIRLQFLSGTAVSAEGLPIENACGEMQWNCIVWADERVEHARLPSSELVVPLESGERTPVAVLPDAGMDVWITLELHQRFYFSSTEGWTLQHELAGTAMIERQPALKAASDVK